MSSRIEKRDMAFLDSRDGRTELEGNEERDSEMGSVPRSHVTYGVEEPESEGAFCCLGFSPVADCSALLLGF